VLGVSTISNEDKDKLASIIFQVGLMLSSPMYKLRDLPEEDKAAWIARQFTECGFPMREAGGMAWYKFI
jgi:hypothetical protein